jgi:HEAT repeat protein
LGQIYSARADNGNPQVAQLLRDAVLHGETPEIRRMAIQGVAGQADHNWDVLLQATNDKDPDVLQSALTYVGEAPISEPVDAQLEKLSHAPQNDIAKQAMDLLLKRYAKEGEAGIQHLVARLGDPQNDANAKAALQLINPLGRASVPACMQALSGSPDAGTRRGAALVLDMLCGGKTDRQQAFTKAAMCDFKYDLKLPDPDLRPIPVLTARLQSDADGLVREACAEALGNIGSSQGIPALERAVSQDPGAEVRVRAAQALELIPGTDALPTLAQAVVRDPAPRVRQFAVVSLGWMQDPRAGAPLIAATQDQDVEVRRLAAIQLGRLRSPEALTSLLGMFNDPDEDVRWAAVLAVDNLPASAKPRNSEAVSKLIQAAEDPSPLVSHAAESALQHLGETTREESHFRNAPDQSA